MSGESGENEEREPSSEGGGNARVRIDRAKGVIAYRR